MYRDTMSFCIRTAFVVVAVLWGCSESSKESDGGTSDNSHGTSGDTGANGENDTETGKVSEALFTISAQRADDVNPNAPGTIFIVTWSVDLSSVDSAEIRFGAGTSYGMTAPVDDPGASGNRTLLLGMNPASTYNFQIAVTSGGNEYLSGNREVETGPATNLVSISDFNIADEDARERGFIIAAVGRTVAVIGPDLQIVWWYRSTIANVISARMSYDAQSIWVMPRLSDPAAMETGPLERVSMDTLEVQIYDDTNSSHDITPVFDDTMAFIDYGFGTSECEDVVLEINNAGETREVFRAADYLDDCHINAIRYCEIENVYTISNRSSTVFVVDRSGEVLWRLSDLVPNTEYGEIQHGNHLLEDSLIIFANHAMFNTTLIYGYSRVDGALTYEYDGDEFSNTQGTVQVLPGGNILAVYSNAGALHEADSEGHTVMTIQTSPVGYATWRDDLYGPPNDVRTW
jgi:hypothetical protein